jgi:hypothetical protein
MSNVIAILLSIMTTLHDCDARARPKVSVSGIRLAGGGGSPELDPLRLRYLLH